MRLSANDRRAQIVSRAVEIARERGLSAVNAVSVADGQDFSVWTVRRYYHRREDLRNAVAVRLSVDLSAG